MTHILLYFDEIQVSRFEMLHIKSNKGFLDKFFLS
jgi:hypothetical protein